MSHQDVGQQGFSVVELLISIFVAASFLFTAYQLYSAVVTDGNNARLRSRAANVAYDNLQKYASSATAPCTVVASQAPTAPTDLPAATVSVTFSCPYGTSSKTTKIQAVVSYGFVSPKLTVTEAIYVTK